MWRGPAGWCCRERRTRLEAPGDQSLRGGNSVYFSTGGGWAAAPDQLLSCQQGFTEAPAGRLRPEQAPRPFVKQGAGGGHTDLEARRGGAGRRGAQSRTPGPLRAGAQTSSSTASRQEAGPHLALLSATGRRLLTDPHPRLWPGRGLGGGASWVEKPGGGWGLPGGNLGTRLVQHPVGVSGLKPPLCWQPGGGGPGPKATVSGLLLRPPCLGPCAHPEEPVEVKTARPRAGRAGTLIPGGRRQERSPPGPRRCTRRQPPTRHPASRPGRRPRPSLPTAGPFLNTSPGRRPLTIQGSLWPRLASQPPGLPGAAP